MNTILALGESLVRLSTQKGNRLSNATKLNIYYGGAEANVAINLAQLNYKIKYATKLPKDNGLSKSIVNQLQGYGIDCSNILYGKGRLGSYFLEVGTGLRPTNIIYDRQYSTLAMMEKFEWDLDKLFEGVSLLHITGITLAISKQWQKLGLSLIKNAKKRGIKISFDMNYRQSMWPQKEAKHIYNEILPYVDYLSASKLDAIHFLDIPEIESLDWKYYSKSMGQKYSNIKYIYGTNRTLITPNSYDMTGYIWDVKESKGALSKEYKNYTVVDRVGTGDSYAAGILDGILSKKTLEETVNFAIAASALKHTIHGDINPFSRFEIEEFMNNTENIIR